MFNLIAGLAWAGFLVYAISEKSLPLRQLTILIAIISVAASAFSMTNIPYIGTVLLFLAIGLIILRTLLVNAWLKNKS